MNIQIMDFFRPINVKAANSFEYDQTKCFADLANSFSLSTYQSLYIIDYSRREFIYVSDNPLFLCGLKASVVQSMGYSFYLKHVPQKDLEMLLEVNTAGFCFYNNIPLQKRKKFSISYDFHLIRPKGRKLLVNHKLTPLLLDEDANIRLALCIVSLSSSPNAGNIIIREQGNDKLYCYDLKTKCWNSRTSPKISRSEREILMTISQGHTVEEIANKFEITQSTVKFHRQNILRKLNVRNIPEALSFAANYCLI